MSIKAVNVLLKNIFIVINDSINFVFLQKVMLKQVLWFCCIVYCPKANCTSAQGHKNITYGLVFEKFLY